MSVTQIKVQHNRFKDGCTLVESDEHSGRPSTCHNDVVIKEVKTLIMADRRSAVREIGDELGISKDSVHARFGHAQGCHKICPQTAFRGARTSSS